MVLSRPLALLALALTLAACLGSQPPVRLREPAPIAVAFHLAGADGAAHPLPAALREAITAELAARGFEVNVLDETARGSSLSKIETSSGRLQALAAAAPTARWVLDLTSRVRFFSQLSGRFRWDVDTHLALARVDAFGEARELDVGVAAFLHHDHEREPEALAFVRRQIVSDLAGLLDRVLGAEAAR